MHERTAMRCRALDSAGAWLARSVGLKQSRTFELRITDNPLEGPEDETTTTRAGES